MKNIEKVTESVVEAHKNYGLLSEAILYKKNTKNTEKR